MQFHDVIPPELNQINILNHQTSPVELEQKKNKLPKISIINSLRIPSIDQNVLHQQVASLVDLSAGM